MKSDESVPPTVMLEIVSAALPTLVRVTLWAGLATPTPVLVKVKLAGDRLTEGCEGGGGCELPPPPHAVESSTGNRLRAKAR